MANIKCLNCMGEFDNSETSICLYCGFDQNSGKKEEYHLQPGYVLKDRYLIGRAIGAGGFGVTYIAWDNVFDKKVAVKEYFPSDFATRIQGTTEVCAYDGEKTYQYEAGLTSFVEEAMRLAKLNQLPNIVHIYDSFIYNCTAYIIMDYVEGVTLKEILKERGPLPYDEVIKYVVPVLNVLQKVHEEGIIHRDIAPDNIKINGDEVTLLDFGAARNATTRNSKSLSVIVKPGYAPEEQYRTRGDQGPWTDVYAMAAVMYHLITGKLPIESIERSIKDELKTPTELGFPIPQSVENAIMNALNVKAEYRIQSAKEFADALSGAVEVERVVVKPKQDAGKLSKKAKIIISSVAVVALALIIAIVASTVSINTGSSYNGDLLPNFESQEKESAFEEMEKYGISYQVIGTYELNGVSKDTELIAWQSIEAQTPVNEVEKLDVKIAKAPIEKGKIPDLSALTKEKAIEALKEAGFTNYKFETKENNKYKQGLVCDQSVKAGKSVVLDTKITVYTAKNTTTTTQRTTTQYRQTTQSKPKKTTTTVHTTEDEEWVYFNDDNF